MLEFFYPTAIIFVPFIILFLIIPAFKYVKIIMIFIQLIFSFILASNNFIKKHSLYSGSRIQYIQSTDFYPIKSLNKTIDEDGKFQNISFDKMVNNKFSIIKTKKYSVQCLENYFIEKDEVCPITDIKFYDKPNNIYNDYIQKSANEYFYYTNQNKLGKLYKSFSDSEFEKNNEDSFSNNEINKISRKEFNKAYNPILDFKDFVKFFDVICILLLLNSLFVSIFEGLNDRKLGIMRIINLILQLIILVIYIIRFSKFIEAKQFLFDNEDIYKNDSYFPNKHINIDSIPLALSINIFIINILYFVYPNHELCLEHFDFLNFNKMEIGNNFTILIVFFILSNDTFEILDFVNNSKIFPIYNNIVYNWKISPIKNIYLNNLTNHDLEYDIKWKNNFFKLERLQDFNYINIYTSGNSKLCGKDNLGNNLYFPENIECPINDIFISKYDDNFQNYTRLKLDNDNYLYYTNESKEGKLLIDFRISNDYEIPLNPEGDSESNFYSIPFYEDIDYNKDSYLYSIYYLGINSSSVTNNKLEKFVSKNHVYRNIYITKIVFFCYINLILLIVFLYLIL